MISRLDVAIVIGCLGIGAAVAVPSHFSTAADARQAEVEALARNATAAARLAHSRWLAGNQPPVIDGPRGVVAMTHGYPSAATMPLMLGDAEVASFVHESGIWRHKGSRSGCGVSYNPPAAAGQKPAINSHTAGC